ncbi:MAG: arginine--tRNA ligase [bacterium]
MEKFAFYNNPQINLIDPAKWNQAKEISSFLAEKIAALSGEPLNSIIVERPKDRTKGDYSTNYAMQQAKKQGKNPLEIAIELANKLKTDPEFGDYFEKIEAVRPGFINFSLKKAKVLVLLADQINTDNGTKYQEILAGKRISFEFAHPNPFKAFHIGHLRNIILGESIIRILEEVGAEVIRVNYQGDVGMHIAKSIWGILTLEKNQGIKMIDFENKNPKEKVGFLGKAYAQGATAYNENLAAKAEILCINALVYTAGQEIEEKKYQTKLKTDYKKLIPADNKYDLKQIEKIWLTGRAWSLDYLRSNIYTRVYSHFVREYMESETMKLAEDNISLAKDAGILSESQGALIFAGEKYGLDTQVFVNSLGLPTYQGKELGLAPLEFGDHGTIDLSIHNVAVEQITFFKVTFKVKELLNPTKYQGKMYHNAYEFVGLKRGKMSSRTGNVVLAEDILDEAHQKIYQILKDRKGFTDSEKQKIAEKVAIGAVKYSFLNISPFSYLAFDLETSLNFEGNSGPYLQYSFARANKLVKDAENQNVSTEKADLGYLESAEEIALAKQLISFPEAVIEAAKALSPNVITNFLFELAQLFNAFYKTNRILKEENLNKQLARIELTRLTKNKLEKGLNLLGIKTVEKM